MQFDNKASSSASNPMRRALVIDEDKDRYRRKERTTMLKNAGFKVYPVLRLPDAKGRCKPGAFEVIAINAGENANQAIELCDEIKKCNPEQKLFLILTAPNAEIPNRDYAVSNWEELMKKIESPAKTGERKNDLVAA